MSAAKFRRANKINRVQAQADPDGFAEAYAAHLRGEVERLQAIQQNDAAEIDECHTELQQAEAALARLREQVRQGIQALANWHDSIDCQLPRCFACKWAESARAALESITPEGGQEGKP